MLFPGADGLSASAGRLKVRYAPKTPEELWMIVLWKPARCTVLSNIWQMLTVHDLEERVALVDELMKEENYFLQEYITRKKRRWRTMAKNRKTPDMNFLSGLMGRTSTKLCFVKNFCMSAESSSQTELFLRPMVE